MKSARELNNNNASSNSDNEYNFSWQPYLPKIREIVDQHEVESFFSNPLIYHLKPLKEHITFSTLDLNLPNAVIFIAYTKHQDKTIDFNRNIVCALNEKLKGLMDIKVMNIFGSVFIQFPSFSQDANENQEIKKYIFYHLAAGPDYAAFQQMDKLYANATPYPRFLIAKNINFILNVTSFQIDRDFSKDSSPLVLTCVIKKITAPTQHNFLKMENILTHQSNIANIDNNINLVSFRKYKDTLFISIGALPFEQQRRLFYELALADDLDAIKTMEQIFTLELLKSNYTTALISKSPSTPALKLTSQNCNDLFKQYFIKPENVLKAASNTPQQNNRQLNEDINNNKEASQNYSSLFKQFSVNPENIEKASENMYDRKRRRIEKQALVMPNQLFEQVYLSDENNNKNDNSFKAQLPSWENEVDISVASPLFVPETYSNNTDDSLFTDEEVQNGSLSPRR